MSLLAAFAWFASSLSDGSAQEAAAANVPAGMAAFFAYGSCPVGWKSVANAAGRLIVGTIKKPDQVGKLVGRPLGSGEDRRHAHSSFTVRVTLPYQKLAGVHGCCNDSGTEMGEYQARSPVPEATSGLPFAQYAFCEPDPSHSPAGTPGQKWSVGTVSFFTSPDCPTGWEPYERADGFFVVPTVSNDERVGKTYGTPVADELQPHGHAVSTKFTTQKVNYALATSFLGRANKEVARHGTYKLTGSTTTEKVDLPFIKLNICQIQDKTVATSTIPGGLTVFVGAQRCERESGWENAPGSQGRYLVALPEGGEPGLPFGGPPLTPGELRAHTHKVAGSVTLPIYRIAGATGCCAEWYARQGTYSFSGMTDPGVIELPYVSLRHCVHR
ncbi:MAG: hypothetical protein ACRDGM_17015 [bacterium]